MSMLEKDEVLGLTKLFHANRHTTVPADVRRLLNIFSKGSFKLLWLYDNRVKRIYIKVTKPSTATFNAKPWPQR